MGLGRGFRAGLLAGALVAAFCSYGRAAGAEPVAAGPDPGEAAGSKSARSARLSDEEGPPVESITEIMENQEILESLDLLDKLDLFIGEDRFSPHRFE